MTEQANRVDWLERQLAQVRDFVARDKARMVDQPERFSVQLSLNSWEAQQEELQQELRQAKAALLHEVVEMRLVGKRMDGSIPLRLLSKLADKFNSALEQAAYHLRHGQGPKKNGLEGIQGEMDLRLSGLAFGSTRLVFAGNITPDTTGDSAMEGALEQIFDVLAAPSAEKVRKLVTAIGAPATRALSDMLGALEKQDIGAQLTWPAPNAKVYQWGGTLDAVRNAHKKLSTVEILKPTPVTLSGVIVKLQVQPKEIGAIFIKTGEKSSVKISYNKQQYIWAKQFNLGQGVELKAMEYIRRDPITDREYVTYKLITED